MWVSKQRMFLEIMIDWAARDLGGRWKQETTIEKLALWWLGADCSFVILGKTPSALFTLSNTPRSHLNSHQPLKAMHTPCMNKAALKPSACLAECHSLLCSAHISGAQPVAQGTSLTLQLLHEYIQATQEVLCYASVAVDPGLIHLHHCRAYRADTEILTAGPNAQAVISPGKTIQH